MKRKRYLFSYASARGSSFSLGYKIVEITKLNTETVENLRVETEREAGYAPVAIISFTKLED